MLIRAQDRLENIDHLRFLLSLKKIGLNGEDKGALNEYNNLMKEYTDICFPYRVDERKQFAKDANNTLSFDDLKNLDFSKMKVGKSIDSNINGDVTFNTKKE